MKVMKHIREEIGDPKFYILVDETCDVAKQEQMALIFRFVDQDGVLQERFFDLIHVKDTKALTLKKEVLMYCPTMVLMSRTFEAKGTMVLAI